jgi:hypothetical protein
MWHYKHCGLRVVSDLPVPELEPPRGNDADNDADVRVALGAVAAAEGDRPTFVASERECRVFAPRAGRYEVSEGRRIRIRPYPLAEPVVMRLVLLGSAWGALLHQRGAFALHAAVTSSGDGAVAFCGPPAAGKSSTAAWLVQRGHPLISDDLCRLDVPAVGSPQVWPSTPRLKLSREALQAGGWATDGLRRELPDGNKHYLPCEGARGPAPRPLRAIYVLQWGEPAVTRLRGIEAVQRFVVAATYRPQLLESESELARHWLQSLEIARRVPVYELSRRREWSSMDHAMNQLALEPSTSC